MKSYIAVWGRCGARAEKYARGEGTSDNALLCPGLFAGNAFTTFLSVHELDVLQRNLTVVTGFMAEQRERERDRQQDGELGDDAMRGVNCVRALVNHSLTPSAARSAAVPCP